MDEIAEALVQIAESLSEDAGKTAAARPWSPRVMAEWLKTIKAPVNALGHEWKKASEALKEAERGIPDREAIIRAITDARDALDAISEYVRMAQSKAIGSQQYAETAEE